MSFNSPLALNSWVDIYGPNSYGAAIDAVKEVFDPAKDAFLGDNPALTAFMTNALYDRIAQQSQENYGQYLRIEPRLTDDHTEFTQGNKSPAELTLFLFVTQNLQSIETARRTRRQWNVYDEVDHPVRSDLDANPLLYTKAIKSAPLYRIKNLNVADRADQYYVQIDRKRTIRQHFGGRVLTIARNSLVLHNTDKSLPRDIRILITDEREKARSGNYDYDEHSDVLHDHLEEHMLHHHDDVGPSWATPIQTSYYAAKRQYIKAEQLLKFDSVESQEIT
jgi:hypothetical protein